MQCNEENNTPKGQNAIERAKEQGMLLIKLADPQEGEREVTPEEAEQMLRENLPNDHILNY